MNSATPTHSLRLDGWGRAFGGASKRLAHNMRITSPIEEEIIRNNETPTAVRLEIPFDTLEAAPPRDRRCEGLDEAAHGSEAPRRVRAAGGARHRSKAWPTRGRANRVVVFGFEQRRIVLRFEEMVQTKDSRRAVRRRNVRDVVAVFLLIFITQLY